MNILALDLGTKTGYCFGDTLISNPVIGVCGTWTLSRPYEVTEWRKRRLDRRCDPRIARLYTELSFFHDPHLVVFEDVEFASALKQVQLWSSLRASAWLKYPASNYECVPVGTLKKFATGHGGATKEMMRAALIRQHPRLLKGMKADDNAVDAIWIWLWAKHNLSRIKT